MLEENLSVIIDAENFTAIFSHINHTRNSLLVKDGCGFIRTLSFTREYADWIWITRISFPLFLILGTVGNALAIATVHSDRRGPKRTFLLGLFCSDLWFLWNRLVVLMGSKVWDVEPQGNGDLYGNFYRNTAGVWLYLESVLFFSSQWILLAFCVDRFLAIGFPLHHHTKYRRFSYIALAAIFAGSALNALYIPIAYYWMLHNSMLQAGRVIPQLPTIFRQWRRIEMWWEVVIRLMAYTGTATLNMMIINRLRNSDYHSRARQKIAVNVPRSSVVVISGTLSNHHAIIRRTNSANAANKILILNSLFFLTTQSLDFGMSVLVAFSQAPICLFHITNGFIQVYDPFRNFLVNMYFAFGFAFYLCCGENSFTGRILGVSWCRRPSEEPVLRYRGSETKITSLMTPTQDRELHPVSSRRSTTTF